MKMKIRKRIKSRMKIRSRIKKRWSES